jgi:hypothetical protein
MPLNTSGLWPFNPPVVPKSGLLIDTQKIVELAYWDGVKDGSCIIAIVLILLFLLFHRD